MRFEAAHAPLEMWGGVECTVNRVGDRWFDQLVWSGHDRRADDLDRFAALGVKALRYPALWERMAPHSLDSIDWSWTDERFGRMRDLGIRPIVGLVHHGSGPGYTWLLDEQFPSKLARFAEAVAQRYPWIEDFTPINEPLTTARFSALYGHWYPHLRSDRAFVRALLNQIHGVSAAMRAIRGVIPNARLVQTEDCGRSYGTRRTHRQVEHERHRRWLTWDLVLGRVDDRHPLHAFLTASGMSVSDERRLIDRACAPAVIGLNYYLTSDRYLDHRLERYPSPTHGGNHFQRYADVEAVRARPQGIAGHEANLREAWERYGIPVAITEVHLGCTRDEQIRWLVESWEGASAARASGADVRAVTAWALLGSHNWNSLVTRDEGHYEPGAFDVRAPQPRRTALCSVISTLASGGTPDNIAVSTEAWWRRPDRLLYAPVGHPLRGALLTKPGVGHSFRGAPHPILIVGASGTLGRAFHRLCRVRGLPSRLLGRPEMDICDPARVDAVVRQLEPWAVINAAGYVRVDDAERDSEACRRANVTGAVNLAAACRRHGVRLVTFSSDLVFDGGQQHPYTEDDEPRPLNVYGASKAEADRRVADLLPEALILRTAAFFGPWDTANFISHVIRTLDAGGQFEAAVDMTVSPTYVPDLVHAALDLLIDEEHGVWHLANQGAVSWYSFAQEAAVRAGRPTNRITAVEGARAWGPAPRPPFSALTSRRGLLLRPLAEALDAFVREGLDAATSTDDSRDRACAS
jgi:dTDP-4-dehydrorhamnose reductase